MTFEFMSNTLRSLICGLAFSGVCIFAGGVLRAEDEPPKKSGFFSRITGLVKKKEEAPPAEKDTPKSGSKPEPKPEPKTGGAKSKASAKAKSKPDDDEPPAKAKSSTASSSKKKTSTKSSDKEPEKKSPKSEVAKKSDEAAAGGKKPAGKDDPAKGGATAGKSAPASDKTTANDKSAKDKNAKDKGADEKKTAATVASTKASDPKKPAPAVSEASTSVDPPGRPMGGFAPGDDRALDVTSSSRSESVSTTGSAKLTEPPASANIINQLPPGKNGGWDILKYEGRDYLTAASIQRFYDFATLKVEGKHVWLKQTNLILKAEIGSMDMLINNVKFVLSYPVAEIGSKVAFSRLDLCKLIDPVLRPSFITDAEPFDTVVLDAGHGGHDSGAKGVYGYEKDFTLKMALVTKASLEKRGFRVVMTRTTDEFISRTGRVAIANKTPNSIFISLHFNSAGPAATGIETFALTPTGASASLERGGGFNASGLTGNRQDSENIALATAVHAKVVSTYKLIDRGIKRAQWTVLTGCTRPGILFEGGFVTNAGECRFIASDAYRRALADTIGDAVVNYRRALQPGMVKRR